jgi:putative ABC transport system permease protein
MRLYELTENIKIAFDGMRTNMLRSLLASLGVVVGISFVILMGWLLSSLDDAVDDVFNMIGTDMLYVDKWDWTGQNNWRKTRSRDNIEYKQYKKFKDKVVGAEVIFPTVRQWNSRIKYGSDTFTGLSIIGTEFQHSHTSAGDIDYGRHFTEFEDNIGSNVIVLGHNVAKELFPNRDAIGKIIRINGHKFEIIGVIPKKGSLFMDFIDNDSFIPIKAFVKAFGGIGRSMTIGISAGSVDRLDEVRDEVIGKMRLVRNLKPHEENDFSINETKAFERTTETIRSAVWGIGIGMTTLSFIVGIIGIMNIMFVAVTERTKEIGIRKAIGAKKSSIILQFVVESAALSFAGAILSMVFCSGLVFAAAEFLPKAIEETRFLSHYLPIDLVVIASVVSIIVGILAGIIPAIRAANLNPVDALRYE